MNKWTKTMGIVCLAAGLTLTGCGDQKSGGGSIGEQVGYQIIGIDPGAGLMIATAEVIEQYGLSDWKLVEGSGSAMTAALDKAYNAQEPIIVTGWTPHWKFGKYDLKYLDDPKGVYGQDEQIHTVVRQGLKDDAPAAYAFLDRFAWTSEDMAEVMVAIQEGQKAEDAAADWVSGHADQVDEWLEGVEPDGGGKIKLAYVAWDSEIASTHVVQNVLETRLGYEAELLQVEAGPMWAGIADGSADAMVAAWLPTTHADYYNKYKDQLEDLGPNLNGTKLGLVVPAYMEIDSIEDLAG